MTVQANGTASAAPSFRVHVFLLLAVVLIAGLSQGLLLPLLSILLEGAGVSSDLNGLNSAALYIGTFCTMFFIERPVARFGYKKVITAGMIMVAAAVLLFPAHQSLALWFALRLIVGIGDSALHYATQLWIVSLAPADKRGRTISLYGMAYGVWLQRRAARHQSAAAGRGSAFSRHGRPFGSLGSFLSRGFCTA